MCLATLRAVREAISESDERSRRKWPWYVTMGVALLMWILATLFSLKADPEVVFWRQVIGQKLAAADSLRERDEKLPTIYVGGGSSCSFSIHPDILTEETGFPAVNLGGSAGMGYRYLIDLATSRAEKGDIVILQLEPEILQIDGSAPQPLAVKMELVGPTRGAFEGELYERPVLDRVAALRPGAQFLGTLAAKVVRGGPLYRYRLEDIQANGVLGMVTTEPNGDREGLQSMAGWLENEVVQDDLKRVAEYGRKMGIKIYYTLPWEVFRPEVVDAQRLEHAKALKFMEDFLPVIRDTTMGATAENDWFLDTGYHMRREPGRERTRVLGQALIRVLEKEL